MSDPAQLTEGAQAGPRGREEPLKHDGEPLQARLLQASQEKPEKIIQVLSRICRKARRGVSGAAYCSLRDEARGGNSAAAFGEPNLLLSALRRRQEDLIDKRKQFFAFDGLGQKWGTGERGR